MISFSLSECSYLVILKQQEKLLRDQCLSQKLLLWRPSPGSSTPYDCLSFLKHRLSKQVPAGDGSLIRVPVAFAEALDSVSSTRIVAHSHP